MELIFKFLHCVAGGKKPPEDRMRHYHINWMVLKDLARLIWQ
jgi:hypothetical protein